ncbi:Cysteine/Histidine-rich C1 domain family protein [Arabidopsis thaliana]|uniref:Cysteine/Histidine-rich C1 domain family protein n=1 Tax=Arabidopsis thaliana TaxID=3702 RepID=F4ILF9_ARATH|nr:Cysteine/Histidine-rich C1 domain family protein [Arabidopsis thaliana]AEC07410.1 Cysteine/Histidine-rich C1 domain family protein [Arabidopsis thaliana]|eukprot:NP_179891.3 Cysteine/Histidine-rich C1 domain family protein [Arabidopsis thaliana]
MIKLAASLSNCKQTQTHMASLRKKLPLNRFRRRLDKLRSRHNIRSVRQRFGNGGNTQQQRPPTKHLCPFSDPVEPHKLQRRRLLSQSQLSECFGCKGKHLEGKRYYYFCPLCNLEFHRGCHVLPQQMKHPLHLSHPLTLISLDPNFDTSKIPQEWGESSSSDSEGSFDSDDEFGGRRRLLRRRARFFSPFFDVEDDDDDDVDLDDDDDDDDDDDNDLSDIYYGKCKCCQKRFEDIYYHCSVCNFSLNFTCTIKPPPLTITHLKSHSHILTLFPRRIPLPCDVCGLSLNDAHDPVYACLPCNYMVHRACINLPRVIKITRHQHRLSLISSLISGDFSCGVCRKTIDISYGHYSCIKGCCYGAHSKCATNKNVWDGKDLEDVPEEPEEVIEPFVRIDEETIHHFTHSCHLKLQGKGSHRGEKKFCKACCFPISIYDTFYTCLDCDFVLHEACACLPRIQHHPLHKHPLILNKSDPSLQLYVDGYSVEGMFACSACRRHSTGFVYSCNVEFCDFQVDVKCAFLPDTSVHESHPNHPIYINLTKGACMGCSNACSRKYLECLICDSFLGVECATLPSVAHYKHDSHPLTLCYGEKGTTSGQYWCEICESKLDASEWFYTCDSCRVTLHLKCLLGNDMYIKPQHFVGKEGEIEIALNDGNTRPFCSVCHVRCTDISVFKYQDNVYCDLGCVRKVKIYESRGSELFSSQTAQLKSLK